MWSLVWLMIVAVSSADVSVINNTATIATEETRTQLNPLVAAEETTENTNPPTVTIGQITIIGVRGENIVQYFDVPYGTFSAGAPFQNPSAYATEEAETIDNTGHSIQCPQIDSENAYIGNDKCLTLSIFVPENAQSANVLFHIHDSSGNTGSGDPLEYSPENLVSQGIILVLPNYRIGALGFLCSLEQNAPGNAALKDLHLALAWTHEHISQFNGSASNIVVSGSGVGGALVEYLLLSKESRAFISKAITESGSALAPWALDRNPAETVKNLQNAVNQVGSNTETISSYNLGSDLEKLVRVAQNFEMAPCVEQNLSGIITETPWNKLGNENLEITLMIGLANYAAMDKVTPQTEQTWSLINNDNTLLLPNDLHFNSDEDRSIVARQIRTTYFGELNITSNDERRLLKCYSDSLYLYPAIRAARLLVERGATVYFYEFSKSIISGGSNKGDSLKEVFRTGSADDSPPDAETAITMLNFWTSFINEGKPSAEGVDWTYLRALSQPAEEDWLSIGDIIRPRRGFHGDRLQIWDDIYRNHFVERSRGLKLNSSLYVTLLGSIFLLDICFGFKL